MKNIIRSLDQVIDTVHQKLLDQEIIIPVKHGSDIQIGSATITSNGPIKDVRKNGQIIFSNVTLNKVAIYLATQAALNREYRSDCNNIFKYDQQYGTYLEEARIFKLKYNRCLDKKHYEKADIFYARYQHSREKAETVKKTVISLLPYNEIMNKYRTNRKFTHENH